MSGPVLLYLSYFLLGIFVIAFVLRTVRLARMPVHLRWELAPIPKEKTRGRYGGSYLEEYEWWKQPREESLLGELTYMGKEIFYLKALWEHNRRLWWFSFPFHLGLYLLIAATGVLALAAVLALAGATGALLAVARAGVPVLAGAGCALGLIGALGLFANRLLSPDLRPMTTRVAYFNLALLLAVFATGLGAALSVSAYAGALIGFGGGLLSASPVAAAVPPVLAAHILLTGVFLAYLPFSQMMHFVAKYFTYHQVRWDDRPLVVGGAIEKEVLQLLAQPVTWGGPHLAADGKKNWVDIATEEVGK